MISFWYNGGKSNVSSSSYYIVNGGIIGDKWQYSNIVKNCYNVGEIAAGTFRGGIISRHQGGSLTITNCYCLSESTHGATPVSAATLKTYASTLGTAYTADPDNRNGGYPILKWEIGE